MNFFGNSANTDLIRQAKGEAGQAPVPTPTLETNKEYHSEPLNIPYSQNH